MYFPRLGVDKHGCCRRGRLVARSAAGGHQYQTTQAENQSKGSDSAPGSAFERAYTWNGSLLG